MRVSDDNCIIVKGNISEHDKIMLDMAQSFSASQEHAKIGSA